MGPGLTTGRLDNMPISGQPGGPAQWMGVPAMRSGCGGGCSKACAWRQRRMRREENKGRVPREARCARGPGAEAMAGDGVVWAWGGRAGPRCRHPHWAADGRVPRRVGAWCASELAQINGTGQVPRGNAGVGRGDWAGARRLVRRSIGLVNTEPPGYLLVRRVIAGLPRGPSPRALAASVLCAPRGVGRAGWNVAGPAASAWGMRWAGRAAYRAQARRGP
jgi:hypothetical protein